MTWYILRIGVRKGVFNNFIDYPITGWGYIRRRIGPYNISQCGISIVIIDENHDDNYNFISKILQLFFHLSSWWYNCFVRISRYDACNDNLRYIICWCIICGDLCQVKITFNRISTKYILINMRKSKLIYIGLVL